MAFDWTDLVTPTSTVTDIWNALFGGGDEKKKGGATVSKYVYPPGQEPVGPSLESILGRGLYNYDVAPVSAGYGRQYEYENTMKTRARVLNEQVLDENQRKNAELLAAWDAARRAAEAEKAARAKADAKAEAERIARENAQYRSVIDRFVQDFEDMGLNGQEIYKKVRQVGRLDVLANNTALLTDAVRSTKTWQNRFGAIVNERRKKGFAYLNESQIMAQESGYREVLQQYGLPKGFYDSASDFQRWIAEDVSISEISARAQLASQAAEGVDDGTRSALASYYGVGRGDLTAYFLDRGRSVELMQKQLQAATLGSELDAAGVTAGKGLLEDLAGKDVSRQELRQAANRTGTTQDDWKRLAELGDTRLTQQDLLSSELGMDAGTEKKKRRLESKERARFGGSGSGVNVFGEERSGQF